MRWPIPWLKAGLLALFLVPPAQAVYLESTIYDMPPDARFISKKLLNDSTNQNIYSISAVRIDKPGAGGEKRSPITEGELLFTPLHFSLAPGAHEFFKIFYRGPQDNKERYYRILFRETAVAMFPASRSGKKSISLPVVAMETILIVRPRKESLSWQLDENTGELRNTGNTYFRVIVHNGCQSTDEDANMLYLLPGEKWNSNTLKKYNRKFIVAQRKYFPIGNACKNNAGK